MKMAEVTQRPLAGGPLSVDLANTLWNNAGERVDWLELPGAVQQFCGDHGVDVAALDHDEIRKTLIDCRSLLRRLFEFVSDPENKDSAELTKSLDDALATARVRVTFDDAAVPSIRAVETRAVSALATDALIDGLELGHRTPDRLRCCSGDGCILWFWDSSKGGRRRWCSMERCGNRAKAQRHYNKTRNRTTAPTTP